MRMMKVARMHDGDIRFDTICPEGITRLLEQVTDGTETRKVEVLHLAVVGALPTVDARYCGYFCCHTEGTRVPVVLAHVV